MKQSNIDKELLASLRFEPLTKANWNQFLQLFGPKGACGNCWCMYYRLKRPILRKARSMMGIKKP